MRALDLDHGAFPIGGSSARHLEIEEVQTLDRGLDRLLALRDPLVGDAVSAIQERLGRNNVLPNDLILGRDLAQDAGDALADQRVAVGQALRVRRQRAVEVGGLGVEAAVDRHTLLLALAFPHDLERGGIELDDARVVAANRLAADLGELVRQTVASPTAVVVDHDMTLARQTLGDHVGVVRADDGAEQAKLRGLGEVGADLPYNLAGLMGDDPHHIALAGVHDDVLGVEALVALVEPVVRAQVRCAVHVEDVTLTRGTSMLGVGVAEHCVLGGFVKTELVEVVEHVPLPKDVALAVDLDQAVVQQQLRGDLGLAHVVVREHQHLVEVGIRILTRSIIANRVAGYLEVVMLTGHPALAVGILHQLVAIESPFDVAVHIDHGKIFFVLEAVLGGKEGISVLPSIKNERKEI